MKKILVTGASGFVGSHLCPNLAKAGYLLSACIRYKEEQKTLQTLYPNAEIITIGDLSSQTDWSNALHGVDVVIHLAARVHQLNDTSSDPMVEYRNTNVDGTVRLAQEAVKAGVRRFILLGSVKVYGESTSERPITEYASPDPQDPYGVSKLEATQKLFQIAKDTQMDVLVLHPPLVYGPGVKANFLNAMKLAKSGLPLPLASVHNKRSLIYVGNLVNAITKAIEHPTAINKAYLVSDAEDISTPDLIRTLTKLMGRKSRLLPFPPGMLRLLGRAFNKSSVVDRLLSSFLVDSSAIRKDLNWQPPYSLEEGLRATVEDFISKTG